MASCEDPESLARYLFKYRLDHMNEPIDEVFSRWMEQDIPAVTSMILENYESEFIKILEASIIKDLPFARYPGTIAILPKLDLLALNQSLPSGSLCRLLGSIPVEKLTLNCVEFLISGCGNQQKAAELLKVQAGKQASPLMFKLIMMLSEEFRPEIASEMIETENFGRLIQDGIEMIHKDVDMPSFFSLFVVQKLGKSTDRLIDNVFNAVLSLKEPALYRDLTAHFAANPNFLKYYATYGGPDRLMARLESFPPELVDEFLIILLQTYYDRRNYNDFTTFIKAISRLQDNYQYICSGRVLDAIAKKISKSHRRQFLTLRPSFEKMLAGFKFPSTANEVPHLCSLLNSLTQDEVTTSLAEFQSSHCH